MIHRGTRRGIECQRVDGEGWVGVGVGGGGGRRGREVGKLKRVEVKQESNRKLSIYSRVVIVFLCCFFLSLVFAISFFFPEYCYGVFRKGKLKGLDLGRGSGWVVLSHLRGSLRGIIKGYTYGPSLLKG